jgi:hypothetical protein
MIQNIKKKKKRLKINLKSKANEKETSGLRPRMQSWMFVGL